MYKGSFQFFLCRSTCKSRRWILGGCIIATHLDNGRQQTVQRLCLMSLVVHMSVKVGIHIELVLIQHVVACVIQIVAVVKDATPSLHVT